MAARDVERSNIGLLIMECKNADSNAAGDAEQHGFRERLASVGSADAGVSEHGAKGGSCGHIAGEMPAGGGIGRNRIGLFDNETSGCGVTLAGLFHAGADQLLEMFVSGHCRCPRSRRAMTLRVR